MDALRSRIRPRPELLLALAAVLAVALLDSRRTALLALLAAGAIAATRIRYAARVALALLGLVALLALAGFGFGSNERPVRDVATPGARPAHAGHARHAGQRQQDR